MARRGGPGSHCPKGPVDAIPATLAGVARREGDLSPCLEASNYGAQIVFCKRCCCPDVISA